MLKPLRLNSLSKLTNINTPFSYRLIILSNFLKLPCSEVYCGVSLSPNSDLDKAFSEDGDKFVQETVDECVTRLQQMKGHLINSRRTFKTYKYVEEQYGLVLDKILEKIDQIAISNPLALLEIFVLQTFTSSFQQLVLHLIPWFIRYGEEADITEYEILQKLQHVYYRDYVARLPADSLHTYLVSDNPQERVMAVNKYKLETGLE